MFICKKAGMRPNSVIGARESGRQTACGGLIMTNLKTAMMAVAMAVSLTASQAVAAETSLLVAGKPAGVHEAQRGSHLLVIAGAATLAVIAIVIASQQGNAAPCGSACTVPT